jgi:O-antigen ligase
LVLGLLFIPSLFRSLSQAAWVKDFVRFGLGVGAFAFMYYWVRTRARDGKLQFVRRFLQWMVVGGVGSVLVLIWQYVNSGIASIRNVSMVNIYSYRQTSTFLDPNYYGEFLVTLLPLAIALALTEPKRWQRVTFGLLAAFLGLGIVLTFSRSALTAMTLAVLVFLIYFARSRQLTLVKVAPSVVGLVLLLSVTVSVILGIGWLRCRAWVVSQILLNRIVGITGTATSGSGVDQRVAILKSSLAMLRTNVWVGAGLGNFERQFVFYQTGPTGGSYRDAHNTFIRLWAETGVFSFLAYIVFLVLSGWFVVQRLRRTRDAVWGLVSAALLAGWLGSLVASMFLDQLLEAYYWIYYGLMMGVAASVTREESEPLRQPDGKGERVSATRG